MEDCHGIDCEHEHGKVYELREGNSTKTKKYTCVKIRSSEPFPIWTNAVNRIMCQ